MVSLKGIDANTNHNLRTTLANKQMKVAVLKNSLARRAFDQTALDPLCDLISGPSALVWGGETVIEIARELITLARAIEHLTFLGALMEGQLFGADQIRELSLYPTREEAQGQAVQLVLSPGQNVLAAAVGPGRRIASILKTIQERLETDV